MNKIRNGKVFDHATMPIIVLLFLFPLFLHAHVQEDMGNTLQFYSYSTSTPPVVNGCLNDATTAKGTQGTPQGDDCTACFVYLEKSDRLREKRLMHPGACGHKPVEYRVRFPVVQLAHVKKPEVIESFWAVLLDGQDFLREGECRVLLSI